METKLPEIKVGHANVMATDRCNFHCNHCFIDKPEGYDMTPDDAAVLMERINNPLFGGITWYGGEPRVNKQLTELINVVRNQVHQAGRRLRAEPETQEESAQVVEARNDFLDKFPREERERLVKTGERTPAIYRFLLNSGLVEKVPVSMELYTNGFGMKSLESTARIVGELFEQGVNQVAISLDPPHRQFAQEHGIPIDYEFLEQATSLMSADMVKASAGILRDYL